MGTDKPDRRTGDQVPLGKLRGFSPQRMRERRERRGWSQQDLADVAGLSRQTITSWELGTAVPDPRSANKVANAFRCTIRQLVDLPSDEITLADLRMLKGMIITDASSALGISRNTLASIEAAHKPAHPDLIPHLAQLYGVEPSVITRTWDRMRTQRIERLNAEADELGEDPT